MTKLSKSAHLKCYGPAGGGFGPRQVVKMTSRCAAERAIFSRFCACFWSWPAYRAAGKLEWWRDLGPSGESPSEMNGVAYDFIWARGTIAVARLRQVSPSPPLASHCRVYWAQRTWEL